MSLIPLLLGGSDTVTNHHPSSIMNVVISDSSLTQTVLTLQSFILAMITHPEAQRVAHKQLDSVLGRGRLPTFDDRESLPYVTAVLQEVLR